MMTSLNSAGRSQIVELADEAAQAMIANRGTDPAEVTVSASTILAIAHYLDNVLGHTVDIEQLPIARETRHVLAGFRQEFER